VEQKLIDTKVETKSHPTDHTYDFTFSAKEKGILFILCVSQYKIIMN